MILYVLLDTKTGKYFAGSGGFMDEVWIPHATEETKEYASKWMMEEIQDRFPDGLPDGWKVVPLSDPGAKQ